jgi:hypothetical protein
MGQKKRKNSNNNIATSVAAAHTSRSKDSFRRDEMVRPFLSYCHVPSTCMCAYGKTNASKEVCASWQTCKTRRLMWFQKGGQHVDVGPMQVVCVLFLATVIFWTSLLFFFIFGDKIYVLNTAEWPLNYLCYSCQELHACMHQLSQKFWEVINAGDQTS